MTRQWRVSDVAEFTAACRERRRRHGQRARQRAWQQESAPARQSAQCSRCGLQPVAARRGGPLRRQSFGRCGSHSALRISQAAPALRRPSTHDRSQGRLSRAARLSVSPSLRLSLSPPARARRTCGAEVAPRAGRAEDPRAVDARERRADGDAAAPAAVPLARAAAGGPRAQLELAGVVEAEAGKAHRGAQRRVQAERGGVVHSALADLWKD